MDQVFVAFWCGSQTLRVNLLGDALISRACMLGISKRRKQIKAHQPTKAERSCRIEKEKEKNNSKVQKQETTMVDIEELPDNTERASHTTSHKISREPHIK